ncbi:SLC13 family permease [Methylobacterium nodulans]|uniref:Anion transporter n=1 Tax=Methylobacterium nodulans (strain LMG 21967 / CNCM I-2342 / ORS 2060) TaxID=460265 RepID=B8IVL5_METNO|nr:DASS family sodium-coupled anion symporter [Methylobacterium nodulans]ACL62455.1 anion transporter [Methylobacterium nodulans ORS 2060]
MSSLGHQAALPVRTDKQSSQHGLDAALKRIGVPIALLAAVAIWLAPTPDGLSVAGHKALALFGGIFALYLTEAIPLAVTSLLIVPAAALSGITSVRGALEGFSSSSAYLIVGAFILATAMVKTRLAERITYLILSAIGSAPRRITLGVCLVNIVLAFLVPSSTARTAILLPECLSILALYGATGRSTFAVNLLLTLTMTNATIGAGILTATVPNPVTVEFVAKASGHTISYAEWLLYGFPPALLMTFATWALIQKVFPVDVDPAQADIDGTIRTNLAGLGRMSAAEWRTFLVFSLVTLLWATQTFTQFDTTVVCLAGVVLLFLPGFGVITWEDANKGVSWQVLLVAGGGISLGDILLKTGAAAWLANAIFHGLGLGGASTLVVIVVVMFIVQYLHVVFVGTTAMATALLPIILGMAGTAQIDAVALALPAGMIIGGYPLLMFYNTLPSIIVHGTGRLRVSDFPKVGIVICALACLVYALCAATYWRWLGLY